MSAAAPGGMDVEDKKDAVADDDKKSTSKESAASASASSTDGSGAKDKHSTMPLPQLG